MRGRQLLRQYFATQHPKAAYRLQVARMLPVLLARVLAYSAGAIFAVFFVLGFLSGCSHG